MTDDDGHCPICVAVVVVTIAILSAPDTTNAPGPNSRIYRSGDGVQKLFANEALGIVGGSAVSKLGGPLAKLLGRGESSAAARLASREGSAVERAVASKGVRANAAKGAAFEEKVVQEAAKTQKM